jgi:hypothetical protein
MVDRTPLQFPAGVVRKGSPAEMQGYWYESQLVRWVEGVMRPVGGIERVHLLDGETPANTFTGFASPSRAIHTWATSDGTVWTAILCEQHLYVMSPAGGVFDISPTVVIQPPPIPEEGGYGDDIYFGAAGGLTDFTQLLPTNDPVPIDPIYADPMGYGMERPPREPKVTLGHMWSLDNFGDLLLAMTSYDRRLLIWDPALTTSVPAAEVVPTPADTGVNPPEVGGGIPPLGRFFIVTPQRHVMVFNCSDGGNRPNRFEWCSQENIKDWKYDNEDNSAGFYDIEPSSPFVCAVPTRTGILAFTAARSYLVTYMGEPYFYSYTLLGYFNAPISGHAITRSASTAIWYASDGFWQFDGVNISPLSCPLLDYIQRTSDPIYTYRRMQAVYLGLQSELWFFYPKRDESENSLYVCFNFDEKWWGMGKLVRTCGFPGSVLSYPLFSDGTSLFYHEKGLSYADAPELPFAQSAAINVAKGGRQATVRQGIADTRAPAADVNFRIGAARDRILDGSEIPDIEMALAVRREGGKVDFRVTGRDIFIRIESARNGVEPWTFGQMLVKIFPRGGR